MGDLALNRTTERIAYIVAILAGIGFLGFGLVMLFDPIGMLEKFGISLSSNPVLVTELRAFYGGLEIGLGLLLLRHVQKQRLDDALRLAAFSYGFIGTVRLASMIFANVYINTFLLALLVELGIAVIAAVLLVRRRGPGV